MTENIQPTPDQDPDEIIALQETASEDGDVEAHSVAGSSVSLTLCAAES
ncbi:hypothetical protein [Dactylosporangium sp. CA-092794]